MEKDWKSELQTVAREVGCEAVAIYCNKSNRKVTELVACVGEGPRQSCPFGVTPLGECAAGGPAIHREVKNTKDFKYHSQMYLPIDADGTRVGVAWFAAVRPGFFDDPAVVDKAHHCSQRLTLARLSLR